MITYDMIIEAQNFLVENWGEDGKKVIEACHKAYPFNMSTKEYLNKYCVACGGNWGGMFLSGLRSECHEVWEAIPNDMGWNSFACICYVLLLCGVDTSV